MLLGAPWEPSHASRPSAGAEGGLRCPLWATLVLLVAIVRRDLTREGVRPFLWLLIWLVAILAVVMGYAYVIEPLGLYDCERLRLDGYRSWSSWSCR